MAKARGFAVEGNGGKRKSGRPHSVRCKMTEVRVKRWPSCSAQKDRVTAERSRVKKNEP